eukprot:1158732-Pelagomonas_calceolata.AAC.1
MRHAHFSITGCWEHPGLQKQEPSQPPAQLRSIKGKHRMRPLKARESGLKNVLHSYYVKNGVMPRGHGIASQLESMIKIPSIHHHAALLYIYKAKGANQHFIQAAS